jgi:tRNA 2-thiocytidine biosynthesis protein TtcA
MTTPPLDTLTSLASHHDTPDAVVPLHRLEKRIFHLAGKAIHEFNLIQEGDKILVAVSGGKDSWVMLYILNELRKRAPIHFEIIAVNIDQGWKGFRQDIVEDFLAKNEINFHMEDFDIASIVNEKTEAGSTPCSLCSRLRRGSLYGLAEKLKCTKIALGHHLDDFVETSLLNQFFIGRTGAMSPKLLADDGHNVVIRPLMYVLEKDIMAYAEAKKFPIVCCQCPLMCGETVHGDFKRRYVKNLLKDLELKIPNIKQSLMSSLGNVHASHLLDRSLFDYDTGQIRPTQET